VIELFVIDQLQRAPLELNLPHVQYLHKDTEESQRLEVDIVFIVTPAQTHCPTILEWIGRARVIYVEKPVANNFSEAEETRKIWRANPKNTELRVLSHYLSKPAGRFFQEHKELLLDQIGNLQQLQFTLLETTPIHPSRVSGVIPGLGSHALALIQLIVPLGQLRIKGVWAAQHKGTSITAETLAQLKLSAPSAKEIEILVGKGLAQTEKAFRLEGSIATLELDFVANRVLFYEKEKRPQVLMQTERDDGYEVFLRQAICERKPTAMRFDIGCRILQILTGVKQRLEGIKLSEYPFGAAAQEVLK
jgi:predicted dehydrogenase